MSGNDKKKLKKKIKIRNQLHILKITMNEENTFLKEICPEYMYPKGHVPRIHTSHA